MTKPDDQAFPLTPSTLQYQHYGLTKREYFAGLALQGILARGKDLNISQLASMSVQLADKLIDQLNQQ